MNERNGHGTETAQDETRTPRVVTHELDEALIALLAELRQQAQAIDAQARGALTLFLRQQGLIGNWQIAPNGRELIRQGEGQ
jgi:hypothetical protein